ncbi:MAG: hypothetical protein ACFFD4_37965 [Candidatus Odinarchaeota archaeon]
MLIPRSLLVLLLLALIFIPNQVNSASTTTNSYESAVTTISVWTDKNCYLESDDVKLEISIWDGKGLTVETGEISVVDLNGTTAVNVIVSSYLTVVTWVASTDGLVGIHSFQINYSDPEGLFDSSSTVKELLIGKDITRGNKEMFIDLDYSQFNVAKGQIIDISGSLICTDALPYFYIEQETAYLSIEAEIDGNWKILDTIYPFTTITDDYRFNLDFTLPPWISTGNINSKSVFSGSFATDLGETSVLFTINLLPTEKSLFLYPQQLVVERNNLTEQNSLLVNIQVAGFDSDPVLLDIDILDKDGLFVKNLVTNHLIETYSSNIALYFSQDIVIGSYNISGILLDDASRTVLATDSFTVNVVDDLLLDNFYWDLSSKNVEPGQNIQGYLVSREEDTLSAIISRS